MELFRPHYQDESDVLIVYFKAGFKRITAYCVAETFKMRLLASFLKREHNVMPRVFDEAMYVVRGVPFNLFLPGTYKPPLDRRYTIYPYYQGMVLTQTSDLRFRRPSTEQSLSSRVFLRQKRMVIKELILSLILSNHRRPITMAT
jgi:uncharacterized Rmd1/YagE family protein